MDTSQFDRRIAETKPQVDALRKQAEDRCQEFLESAKPYIVGWYEAKFEEAVIDNPALANRAGSRGLQSLKQGMRSLIEATPQLVNNNLDTA